LLRSRDWTGAELSEVVARALDAFEFARIKVDGPEVDVSPRQALALSMALHELATNATKYGALSVSEGRVSVGWEVDGGNLRLSWVETGGPAVQAPARKGFGSRLLERLLVSDLGGKITLD
jgi:two-component sensor histidine kinase